MLVEALEAFQEGRLTGGVERHWDALLGESDRLDLAPRLLAGVTTALAAAGDYDRALDLVDRIVATARERSALSTLPDALLARAVLAFRTGRWEASTAAAEEGLALAEELGQDAVALHLHLHVGFLDAERGLEEGCLLHFGRARELGERLGLARQPEAGMLGTLALGLGRLDEAIDHFERAGGGPMLVEAYARAGRTDEAGDALRRFEARVGSSGRPFQLALLARCRGLLAGDDEFERHFADALRGHAVIPGRFQLARTELCLGERRRRAGRRTLARPPLRSALDAFERLGASQWADRARTELEATGERRANGGADPRRALTAQELRVARAVAAGATNREAASALYLSAKTVDYHLQKIYRKLGVRSRTQLAHVLASAEGS